MKDKKKQEKYRREGKKQRNEGESRERNEIGVGKEVTRMREKRCHSFLEQGGREEKKNKIKPEKHRRRKGKKKGNEGETDKGKNRVRNVVTNIREKKGNIFRGAIFLGGQRKVYDGMKNKNKGEKKTKET